MAEVNERRALHLDRSVGETRGVATLRGRPERLLVERDGEGGGLQAGAVWAVRLRRADVRLGMGFLDLGEGPDAVLPLTALKGVAEGAALKVEIAAEARADKGPTVRLVGPHDGEAPGLLTPAPSLLERLQAVSPRSSITRGPDAREAADLAEAQALATVHPLPEGGTLSIEATRALVACDVDVGARAGGEAKRVGRAVNIAALAELARLLRLKSLAGLIVVDLAGRGHDAEALIRAAREAFHPDNPGVQIGGISRLGLLEIAKPWRERPLRERLLEADGRATPLTAALRLARALEREGRMQGGARLLARAAPEVVAAFEPLRAGLVERLGARFVVEADLALGREDLDVSAR